MSNSKHPSEADKTEVAESDTLKLRLAEAKTASPMLVVISGKPLGKSFAITKETMVLGRDLAVDISIGETSISRRHTEFTMNTEGVSCRDLGSTNGTFVNDQKADGPKPLKDGDLIRCGNTILKFLK